MKLLASQDGVRAWPGGFGYAKVGANYGPSLMANSEARARGYDQVLWLLDGLVTEAGASNFFVVWRSKEGKLQLVTASLDHKIILDGVTRRSILQLARERLTDSSSELDPIEIVERNFSMDELAEVVKEGRIVEAFAAGTAVSCSRYPRYKLKLIIRSTSFPRSLSSAIRVKTFKFLWPKEKLASTLA
jgi:branched-chain amino acid aminotransferase